MPIVPMREMLANALKKNYAVGYFEAWTSIPWRLCWRRPRSAHRR